MRHPLALSGVDSSVTDFRFIAELEKCRCELGKILNAYSPLRQSSLALAVVQSDMQTSTQNPKSVLCVDVVNRGRVSGSYERMNQTLLFYTVYG